MKISKIKITNSTVNFVENKLDLETFKAELKALNKENLEEIYNQVSRIEKCENENEKNTSKESLKTNLITLGLNLSQGVAANTIFDTLKVVLGF